MTEIHTIRSFGEDVEIIVHTALGDLTLEDDLTQQVDNPLEETQDLENTLEQE